VNFSTGGSATGDTVNSIDPGPAVTTTYSLSCSNGGFATKDVVVRVPTLNIGASQVLINPGDSVTVFWDASGVNSCTVVGTDGFADSAPPPADLPDGTWTDSNGTGPLNAQTVYTLTCQTALRTLFETVIININPIFEEF